MNKRRRHKKNRRSQPILLILAVAAILVVLIAAFAPGEGNNSETAHTGPAPVATSPTSLGNETQQTELTEPTQEPLPDETETAPRETAPEETTEPDDDAPDYEDQPSVEIQQQKDAEYERWLAAAMVVCVSIEHPDFEFEAVYAASATELEDKLSSDGAYIVFRSGGKRYAIHSVALEQERSEAGTTDISTEVIGFATFDKVDPDRVDFESLDLIQIEELNELIAQSLLISVYNH